MSLPQHMLHLQKANAVRLRRVEVKRAINQGWVEVADLLREPAPELENMAVAELLRAQHRWGEHKARTFLARFNIGENRKLGRLTKRQRVELSQALAARRNGKS